MRVIPFAVAVLIAFGGPPLVAEERLVQKGTEIADGENRNELVIKHRDKLEYSCSSFWTGWPADRAFDGDPKTSWFTGQGDAAAHGKSPWIAVEFPVDVSVRRVTLLSNREPPYEVGYTILVGRLELLDTQGKVLFSRNDELGGARPDMEVRVAKPVAGVRTVRFTSLRDEGDQNSYDDVALGEMLVE